MREIAKIRSIQRWGLAAASLVLGVSTAAQAQSSAQPVEGTPVRPAQLPPAQAPGPAPAPAQGPAAPAQSSGCDTACVRGNNEIAAQICAPRIEAEAPTDFEWVSRPFAKIFQQAEAPEGAATVVRYRGDSIRFLSPAKEWVRVTYECGFDVAKRSVSYVRVRLGRLDKAEPPQQQVRVAPPAPQAVPAPQAASPQGQQQTSRAGPVAPKKLLPSEPSEVEIRQVNPRIRQAQP